MRRDVVRTAMDREGAYRLIQSADRQLNAFLGIAELAGTCIGDQDRLGQHQLGQHAGRQRCIRATASGADGEGVEDSVDAAVDNPAADRLLDLEPNVRGSSGYGIAWQQKIYKDWGGIDLDDFAAAAAYLTSLDWADPGKLAVMGTSYGGFAALSCMSRLPDLWAAGVSVCGPANLETLARSMPPSWATIVATMIGDPDTEASKLRARSPVTHANQIAAPLLVIQGANDPRVPKAEADQIVEAARGNGADVTYLVFDDEGHGFTSRGNHTKAHTTIAEFLSHHLLQQQEGLQ